MGGSQAPLTAMQRQVDLGKFLGSWYVLAHVPIFIEKNAYNAVETYEWDEKNKRIQVTYKFNEGAFEGKPNVSYQRGWSFNKLNSELRVSPKLPLFGYTPLRLPYLINDIADDYSTVVVGYPSRSYLWIMSRSPKVDDATYDRLIAKAVELGYDKANIRKVPQDPAQPPFTVPTKPIVQ